MTPALVILAVLVAGGAVVAVGSSTPRLAALGMLVALVGSAYVADPLPGPVGLGARLAGSMLAGYLVWIALRKAPVSVPGAAVGLPGAAAIAAVAFVAGFLAAGSLGTALVGTGDGPGLGTVGATLAAGSLVARSAFGAGLALVAVSLGPVLVARDTLRLGIGLLLLLAAATLVRNGLGTSGDEVLELGVAVLTAFAGAGVSAVIDASLQRTGDLALRDSLRREPAIRHRPADDAHRRQDRPAE